MASPKTRRRVRRHGGHAPANTATRKLPLVQVLIDAHRSLDNLERPHALVGGLAVSARAEPRTTRDTQ